MVRALTAILAVRTVCIACILLPFAANFSACAVDAICFTRLICTVLIVIKLLKCNYFASFTNSEEGTCD